MAFNPNELEPQFNEQRFWRKLRANLRRAGKDVIRHCLCLYYAAQKPETPLWAKTVVYGALAYFIIPLDAIPDAIFVIGYSDDLAVLSAALVTISLYVDAEVERQADRSCGSGLATEKQKKSDGESLFFLSLETKTHGPEVLDVK